MLFDSTVSWIAKENKIIAIAKPKRVQLSTLLRKTYDRNTSFSLFFKEKKLNYKLFLCNELNELRIWMIRDFYFYF